jgi:hypothetical protein
LFRLAAKVMGDDDNNDDEDEDEEDTEEGVMPNTSRSNAEVETSDEDKVSEVFRDKLAEKMADDDDDDEDDVEVRDDEDECSMSLHSSESSPSADTPHRCTRAHWWRHHAENSDDRFGL